MRRSRKAIQCSNEFNKKSYSKLIQNTIKLFYIWYMFYILNDQGFLKVKLNISLDFLKRLTKTWATFKHDYNMRQISRLMPTYDNPPPPHRRSWPEGGDRNHTWVPGDPTAGPGKLWPVTGRWGTKPLWASGTMPTDFTYHQKQKSNNEKHL